jgi:hypothetical protein
MNFIDAEAVGSGSDDEYDDSACCSDDSIIDNDVEEGDEDAARKYFMHQQRTDGCEAGLTYEDDDAKVTSDHDGVATSESDADEGPSSQCAIDVRSPVRSRQDDAHAGLRENGHDDGDDAMASAEGRDGAPAVVSAPCSECEAMEEEDSRTECDAAMAARLQAELHASGEEEHRAINADLTCVAPTAPPRFGRRASNELLSTLYRCDPASLDGRSVERLLRWYNVDVTGSLPSKRSRLRRAAGAGLRNLGNTCYASAIVQLIRHTPGLRDAALASDSVGVDPVATALAVVVRDAAADADVAAAMRRLVRFAQQEPAFRAREQHDAFEFYTNFLG